MSNPDPAKQLKLFKKYWEKGEKEEDLSAYGLANDLRKKLIPSFLEILKDLTKVEEKKMLASEFGKFAEFLYNYFLLLNKSGLESGNIQYEVKAMADKTLELDNHNFIGAYYLVAYSSWNLTKAHAGSSSAFYKGEGAADSIVGTAFNLIGKGLTLGATAAGAGINKGSFNSKVKLMIDNFRANLNDNSPSVFDYLEYSHKMFNIAEFCQERKNNIWRDIFEPIASFNLDNLDYSYVNDDYVDEMAEDALEIQILAHAKL